MPSRRERCRSWKLYAITDPRPAKGRSLQEAVQLAIEGGVSAVQLRDKETSGAELVKIAQALLKITRPHGVPLIINDRVEVARLAGADGVHLGQGDGTLKTARSVLGEEAIIGRSTHSQSQVLLAEEEGFDYIGVGPVFKTPTKPGVMPVGLELVSFASLRLKIPFVAIGGIDRENIERVFEAGARAVAVVRAVIGQEDPKRAAQQLLAGFHAKS